MNPAVFLTTVGAVERDVQEAAGLEVENSFSLSVRYAPGLTSGAAAWDPRRRQYNAPVILADLLAICPRGAFRFLALTELDLYIPMLTFIFGQAQLGGTVAIVSLARLRQEFHGLPGDHELLRERARKEVVHELGHTFGLIHCREAGCVMAVATDLRQLDLKRTAFCRGCAAVLGDTLGRSNRNRMEGHG